MNDLKIIGGGVAGLALGIGLRRAGVPVDLFEAGKYPRHRVCGEFVSGAGRGVIDSLGLRETLGQVGAIEANTGAIFLPHYRSPIRRFPSAATCITRYALDKTLADVFEALGGRLHTSTRLKSVENDPGTVFATGRWPHISEGGWTWFGLKAHATGVELDADLEMHLTNNGYVGLCRLSNDRVNVCGLFRKKRGESADASRPSTGVDALRGKPGTLLFSKLQHAAFDNNSFSAVAGLAWKQDLPVRFCCIGDAYAMTPPITGNGMSIALETAALAVRPLYNYSLGAVSWEHAFQSIQSDSHQLLFRRLRWARTLHRLVMAGTATLFLAPFLLRSEATWNIFFTRTRAGVNQFSLPQAAA